ncbi:hypothetical protein ACWEF9_09515 [Streptomyces sp. NPDC004980]
MSAPEYIAAGKASDGVAIPALLKDPGAPEFADDEKLTGVDGFQAVTWSAAEKRFNSADGAIKLDVG